MFTRKIDVEKRNGKRKAEINLKLSEFENPPMRDALVIGRRAPIGAEAAKCMATAVSPGRFIVIPINDKIIETIVFRKGLLQLVPQEQLVPIIREEAGRIMQQEDVIKFDIDVNISVKRTVDL